ncbi:hypothetical protein ILUMI_09546, partial [Ignelater luminosus]
EFELSARLYDQPNFNGSSEYIFSSSSIRVCLDLPKSFNDLTASIDLQIPCLVVFEKYQCKGEALSIVEDLLEVPPTLKRKISSLQSCPSLE